MLRVFAALIAGAGARGRCLRGRRQRRLAHPQAAGPAAVQLRQQVTGPGRTGVAPRAAVPAPAERDVAEGDDV